jgi:hypothetical protein
MLTSFPLVDDDDKHDKEFTGQRILASEPTATFIT